jgi:hypothetical protein
MRTLTIAARILLSIGATSTLVAAGALGCGSSDNESATTTGAGGAHSTSSTHAGTGGASPSSSSAMAGTGGAGDDGGADAADAMSDAPPCIRRPFLVDSVPRAGGLAPRGDWLVMPEEAEEPPAIGSSAALAEAWALDGTEEHASIAAFSRFTMLLVAVGAPPDLVIGSQRAGIDEVAHARGCFALARRYGGPRLGPGPVSLRGALPADPSLADVAALTVHEGCVGETLGVLLATEQLASATDPVARTLLARIVRDEQRHAELAWRFVRWALSQGDDAVGAAVARAFSDAARATLAMRFADPVGIDAASWRAHGRLTAEDARALVRRGLAEIVEPCRRALPGAHFTTLPVAGSTLSERAPVRAGSHTSVGVLPGT